MITPTVYKKRAAIGGKVVNICDYDSFGKYKEILIEDNSAAVELQVDNRNIALPVRTTSSVKMDRVGLYTSANSPVHFLSLPKTEEEFNIYDLDSVNNKCIDWAKMNSLEVLKIKQDEINKITNRALESSDNYTRPMLKESDTPTMRALKEAINAKKMDIDMYKERFGDNFPNDKRKLNDDDVTLFIFERFCNCLDMEADLIIKDAPGNIANPMNKVITVNIVPGNSENVSINNQDEDENLEEDS